LLSTTFFFFDNLHVLNWINSLNSWILKQSFRTNPVTQARSLTWKEKR